MNERHDHHLDRLLDELEPPAPPQSLRAKAIAAARNAAVVEPQLDLWSAIWNSPALRLAWAASVVALVAGHLLVWPGNGVAPNTNRQLTASNGVDTHLVEFLRPVRIATGARPMVGATGIDDSLVDEMEGNPS
jgi:hypothetical protein